MLQYVSIQVQPVAYLRETPESKHDMLVSKDQGHKFYLHVHISTQYTI